jgi:putative ABC transport system permease protein
MSTRFATVVPGLAAADLRHEWILTLCLVIAIAAVVAPLLILQGLKHGTVATLRDRLVQDPVYREIRPSQTREYPPGWLDRLAAAPEVGFLLPTILPASSIIGAVHPGTGRVQTLDLIPTGAGDPLVLENGGTVPDEGACVLTAAAAAQLGVAAGATLEVRATRSRAGATETGSARLRVAAVLDPRAGTLPRLYAPLPFVLDVEAYKEGRGIPARGWAGDVPRPQPSYDGLLVLVPQPLDPIERAGLAVNTGFATIDAPDPKTLASRIGTPLSPGWHAYHLAAPNGTVGTTGVDAVRRKLRGSDAILLPYVEPLAVRVNGRDLRLASLSLTAEQAARLGAAAPPWGGGYPLADANALRQLWVADGPAAVESRSAEVVAPGLSELRFSARVTGGAPAGDFAYAPAELAGILRTGQQRPLAFDGVHFTVEREGFRGFRLYARTIDDVPALVERLRAEGVEVVARADDVRRIQVLDRGLARLFWLVASLGIAGGVAVLVASLYAAVQRKRRDLAVLRLVGLTRPDVFFFPLCQGLVLAGLGVAVALAAYGALAALINRAFAADLDLGQRICDLPAQTLGQAVVAVLGLALASSLAAAWTATRIDPAEAIREE